MRKYALISMLLFFIVIITSACGSGGSSGSCEFYGYPNTLGKITLSKYSFNIGVGYKDKVIVYVNGKDKTNEAVFSLISEQTETNSKNIIANVDKGTITALKAGKTKINVHVDNTEADVTFEVNVNNLPNLEVTKNEFSIILGDNSEAQQIIVTLNGKDRTNEAIFTSSDESVATVDENGNITFVGEGTATIIVHVEGANDIELKVNVYDPENHRINFKTNNMYETEDGFVMYEGETGNITVIIKGKDRTNEGTYTSENDNVVTVDNENIHGKIYALNQGNTSINIHVPDTEEDKVVNVIVKPKPQLEDDSFDMLIGNDKQIVINLNGTPITGVCTFTTDSNDIATVDSAGKITAKGVGTTTVYASYDDGIKVHKLPITVTNYKTLTNDQNVSSTLLIDEEKQRMLTILMDTGMISNENDIQDIVEINDNGMTEIKITIDRE
ncbi:Ig-like domain-containing protein, partial [bacterium]|nr:Ig-like domain-containing protein [bacterium]